MAVANADAIIASFFIDPSQAIASLTKIQNQAKKLGSLFEKGFISTKTFDDVFDDLKSKNKEITNFGEIFGDSFTDGAKKARTGIDNEFKKLAKKDLFGSLGLDNIIPKSRNVVKSFDDINKEINKGIKAAQKFDFSFLSFIFTGMALKRLFGGIFRGMTNTFNKLEDGASRGSQNITALTAAFEFFKFSIFDAIASSNAFSGFIESAVNAVSKVANLIQGTDIGDIVFNISAIGFALGVGLSGIGLAKQIGVLLTPILNKAGIAVAGNLAAGTAVLGVAIGLGILINDLSSLGDSIKEGDTKKIFEDILDLIGSISITAGAATIAFNPSLGLMILTAGVLIRLRNPIIELVEEIKESRIGKIVSGVFTSDFAKVADGVFGLSDDFSDAFSKIEDDTTFVSQSIDSIPTKKNIEINVDVNVTERNNSSGRFDSVIEDEIRKQLVNQSSVSRVIN